MAQSRKNLSAAFSFKDYNNEPAVVYDVKMFSNIHIIYINAIELQKAPYKTLLPHEKTFVDRCVEIGDDETTLLDKHNQLIKAYSTYYHSRPTISPTFGDFLKATLEAFKSLFDKKAQSFSNTFKEKYRMFNQTHKSVAKLSEDTLGLNPTAAHLISTKEAQEIARKEAAVEREIQFIKDHSQGFLQKFKEIQKMEFSTDQTRENMLTALYDFRDQVSRFQAKMQTNSFSDPQIKAILDAVLTLNNKLILTTKAIGNCYRDESGGALWDEDISDDQKSKVMKILSDLKQFSIELPSASTEEEAEPKRMSP